MAATVNTDAGAITQAMTAPGSTRTDDAALLAALDKEFSGSALHCECCCKSFPDRHGPNRCPRPAKFYVEVHLFGTCTAATADPDVTPDGNRACYLCPECLDSVLAYAQATLAKLPTRAQCPPRPAGKGCGRPMASLDDYVPVRRAI